MAATKPKTDKKKKELSPSHVKHLKIMMNMARDPSALAHPLLVPPAGMPAQGHVTEQVSGDDQMIPAKTGEYVIPEPVVRAKGTQFFDNLIKKTLQDVLPPEASQEAEQKAGKGTPETGFRWGGEVEPRGMSKQLQTQPSPMVNYVGGFKGGGPTTIASGNDPAPPIGGVDIPEANMEDPFGDTGRLGGPDLRFAMPWFMGQSQFGYQPPPWAAGFGQGPTIIPTTLGNSGYPMAVAVNADWSGSGPHPHTPLKARS